MKQPNPGWREQIAPDEEAHLARVAEVIGTLEVLDVSGEGALGGTTDHRDFLMINQDRGPTADSRQV